MRELHLLQDYKGVTSQYWENTGKRELVNAEHETLLCNCEGLQLLHFNSYKI